MKLKIIKVWDDLEFGSIPFIVLQVEECDKLLIERNFEPGYKFIVQALYHQVGAAGGYKFNPYQGGRVRAQSEKMDSTEGDVLGFYLNDISNIYDIPSELHTKDFWGVVRTDGCGMHEIDEECGTNEDECYKVLFEWDNPSLEEQINNFREINEFWIQHQDEHKKLLGLHKEVYGFDEDTDKDLCASLDMSHIIEKLEDEKKAKLAKGIDITKPEREAHVRVALVNKETLKVVTWEEMTDRRSVIAKYLWFPHDELPKDLWGKFIGVNEDYSGQHICDLGSK